MITRAEPSPGDERKTERDTDPDIGGESAREARVPRARGPLTGGGGPGARGAAAGAAGAESASTDEVRGGTAHGAVPDGGAVPVDRSEPDGPAHADDPPRSDASDADDGPARPDPVAEADAEEPQGPDPEPYEPVPDASEPRDPEPYDPEPYDGPDDWPERAWSPMRRAEAMGDLAGRGLSAGQSLLLCGAAASAVLGCAFAGLAAEGFERGGLGSPPGLVTALLAPPFLILAAVALGRWTRTGEDVRDGLDDLAYLRAELADPPLAGTPAGARLERRRRTWAWLTLSLAPTVCGVWLTVRAVSGSATGSVGATVYAVGLGLSVLGTGILGGMRAGGHLRWSTRYLRPWQRRPRGGLHR